MGKADLHVHSTASDGRYRPEEIVAKAAALGITALALADHDSVDGVAPALESARAFPDLTFIPNVEISTETDAGEIHILGYYLDYRDAELLTRLEGFRNSRLNRARKMLEKLEGLGMPLSWERVQEFAGTGAIGRPHVAQAMLEKGYITTFREAFDKYISHGGPAYVPRDKMTPAEAVALVVRARGLPGLAHPFTVNKLDTLLPELKAAGLEALEVYYDSYTPEQRQALGELARRFRLVPTGGSDYHGLEGMNETMLGEAGVPEKAVEKLRQRAEEMANKKLEVQEK
ncbi:MAG: PHP domain-containing protein [Chloroflexota bacterium]